MNYVKLLRKDTGLEEAAESHSSLISAAEIKLL